MNSKEKDVEIDKLETQLSYARKKWHELDNVTSQQQKAICGYIESHRASEKRLNDNTELLKKLEQENKDLKSLIRDYEEGMQKDAETIKMRDEWLDESRVEIIDYQKVIRHLINERLGHK